MREGLRYLGGYTRSCVRLPGESTSRKYYGRRPNEYVARFLAAFNYYLVCHQHERISLTYLRAATWRTPVAQDPEPVRRTTLYIHYAPYRSISATQYFWDGPSYLLAKHAFRVPGGKSTIVKKSGNAQTTLLECLFHLNELESRPTDCCIS